jgi:hypothetical protein
LMANFFVCWLGVRFGSVALLLFLMLNRIRLWSDSVFSSLTLQFTILCSRDIDEAVISIHLSPVGPEYVGPSFSFIVSRLCEEKKSTRALPLLSVVGLCHKLCLPFASSPQTKYLGFIVVRKVSMCLRSWSRVL